MNDAEAADRLRQCQESIGYQFSNPELLRLALTHSSDKTSDGAESMLDNERLEFLGDAILGMVVCEKLFSEYPDFTEGELTAIKSVVVSRSVLAKVSSNRPVGTRAVRQEPDDNTGYDGRPGKGTFIRARNRKEDARLLSTGTPRSRGTPPRDYGSSRQDRPPRRPWTPERKP